MKQSTLTVLACLALTTMFALPALYAQDAPADGPVALPAGMDATKTPVQFSHKGHAGVDCLTCHHKAETVGAIKGCASDGCHTDKQGVKDAFHKRNAKTSCVGCHKAEKKGPTKCGDCHPKK